MSGRADVLIVTALKLERQAVRAHLQELRVEAASGLACDVGVFERSHTVAVLQTGAGNVAAAIATARAEEHFRPHLLFMVGIAGGLKDVSLGDVVASEKVYWTEGGKIGGAETEEWFPRTDMAPVSSSLVQIAHAVSAGNEWWARVPDRAEPTAWVAPIAAGEKVLANSRSELVVRLRQQCSDALCVDMEDYGTVRAGGATERTKLLAVRGISDLLDDKGEVESHGSQETAAAHAAAFTFEMLIQELRLHPVPPDRSELVALFTQLYPEGPLQQAVWERAGGDPSTLELQGSGRERWWRAVTLVQAGGKPTLSDLVLVMRSDFPNNAILAALGQITR